MTKICLALALVLALLVPAAAQARDGDRDGMPDRWEKRHGTQAKKKSAGKDPDGDSVSNLGEFSAKTDPRRKDSDRDGVRDDDEDRDRDAVDNGNEERQGTSSRKRDSDRDGLSDAREDRDRDGLSNGGEDSTGNDPLDRDTDDDGTRDGAEQAGVVASFEGGVLTIDLANGAQVAGLVDDMTEIDCDSERAQEASHGSKTGRGGRSGRASTAIEEDLGGEDDLDDDFGDEDEDFGDEDEGLGDDENLDGDEGLGEDELDDEDEDKDAGPGSDGEPCSAADLRPGVRIHEADATLTEDGLVFDEIALLR